MFATLGQQEATRFLPQSLQSIELLIEERGPLRQAWFAQLLQPLGSGINALAGAVDPLAPVDRFEPVHHACAIVYESEIAAAEFFQPVRVALTVVDRL